MEMSNVIVVTNRGEARNRVYRSGYVPPGNLLFRIRAY